jgi:hypothetical protein
MTATSDMPATPAAQLRTRSSAAATASPRVTSSAGTGRLAARVAVATCAGVLVLAGVVRVTLATQVRGWLGYSFRGVPARLDVAIGIFAHNGRAILGVFGMLLIAQLAARAPRGPGRTQRLIRTGGELVLAGVIAANVLVVGAGLGAYGAPVGWAMLPHGPIELAAYCTALALYLQGRRRPLPIHHVAKVAAASFAMLALAAALETFVNV